MMIMIAFDYIMIAVICNSIYGDFKCTCHKLEPPSMSKTNSSTPILLPDLHIFMFYCTLWICHIASFIATEGCTRTVFMACPPDWWEFYVAASWWCLTAQKTVQGRILSSIITGRIWPDVIIGDRIVYRNTGYQHSQSTNKLMITSDKEALAFKLPSYQLQHGIMLSLWLVTFAAVQFNTDELWLEKLCCWPNSWQCLTFELTESCRKWKLRCRLPSFGMTDMNEIKSIERGDVCQASIYTHIVS